MNTVAGPHPYPLTEGESVKATAKLSPSPLWGEGGVRGHSHKATIFRKIATGA